jgi:C-terminal processing protease CtpA/Prc
VPWYNPRATSDAQRTTRPDPASRLANKPLFILTSRQTFSGAEHFTYNLKLLKRATIVGERTSGASHAGAGASPSKVALPEPKPAWEGIGVTPDVRVNAGDALATAELLAQRALGKN